MYEWEPLESPQPPAQPVRSPWKSIFAAAISAALLTAAAGWAVLWGTGVLDEAQPIPSVASEQVTSNLVSSHTTSIEGVPLNTENPTENDDPEATPTDDPEMGSLTKTVADVANQAVPSIVTVYKIGLQTQLGFGQQEQFGRQGSGSGVVFKTDGYILTNDHVIEGATSIEVVLHDGLTLPATLVGTDPLMDIAVLKVDHPGLPPIEFADLSQAQVGDPAVAIGNPLGLDGGPSVTYGIISAFDRTLASTTLFGLLQTDAPITRGSSGGALLDSDGRLLGITTAIGISDVGAEGLGFAVPVNLVAGIADDILEGGEVKHGFLGIQGGPALNEEREGVFRPTGVEITEFLEDSALQTAGGQEGDIIVAINDDQIASVNLLVARLRSYRAGEQITVAINRQGEVISLEVTLGQYPSN